ncbi:hypothetical protein L6452_08299 [Arctium lappa]|uniref:Uncharacterized protein n=1 Tax=Arctium lappa TaxID=4217 RepID=A0ACB9DHD4_ARCLA|nr:hypothetical protein L6452_08299 [Arctium lappa]
MVECMAATVEEKNMNMLVATMKEKKMNMVATGQRLESLGLEEKKLQVGGSILKFRRRLLSLLGRFPLGLSVFIPINLLDRSHVYVNLDNIVWRFAPLIILIKRLSTTPSLYLVHQPIDCNNSKTSSPLYLLVALYVDIH